MSQKPAIFFDRDGVITELVPPSFDRGPLALSELKFLGNPEEFLKETSRLGFINIVVTNQPDIERGRLPVIEHGLICSAVMDCCPSITKIYVCPHDNYSNCMCRKPLPGLIDLAAQELNINLEKSWLVGDKWTDILAGKSRDLRTILVRNQLSWTPTSQGSPPKTLRADFEVVNVREILGIVIH